MNEGAPGLDFQTWASAASATVFLGRSAANGNLLAHSDSVMGDWGFGYDTLNRLTGAAAGNAPTADGAPATWVNSIGCYNYDSFGNRTVAAITTTGDCSSRVAHISILRCGRPRLPALSLLLPCLFRFRQRLLSVSCRPR